MGQLPVLDVLRVGAVGAEGFDDADGAAHTQPAKGRQKHLSQLGIKA